MATHLDLLKKSGLHPMPLAEGRYKRGTIIRDLADDPPDTTVHDFTPQNGLAILLGTPHPDGGYVIGVDIDHGPDIIKAFPGGFLYMEQGTRLDSWHIFMRTADRLEGQINLIRQSDGDLVCEIKGYGQALRSYPSIPTDKPRGYTPLAFGTDLASKGPLLPYVDVARAYADWLCASLGYSVIVKPVPQPLPRGNPYSDATHLKEIDIVGFASRFTELLQKSGAFWGKCPLHNDRTPSFVVKSEGVWYCHGACKRGGNILGLAQALREKGVY